MENSSPTFPINSQKEVEIIKNRENYNQIAQFYFFSKDSFEKNEIECCEDENCTKSRKEFFSIALHHARENQINFLRINLIKKKALKLRYKNSLEAEEN